MPTRFGGRLAAATVLATAFAAGCHGYNSNGTNYSTMGTTSQPYTGTVTGSGGETGMLSFSVATAPGTTTYGPTSGPMAAATATDAVTGTLQFHGGASISLSGTFDPGSGTLQMSGGGTTLMGTLATGHAHGTFNGSAGSGDFDALGGGGTMVSLFCGALAGADSGSIGIVLAGPAVTGSFQGGSDSGHLSGSVSGSTVTLTADDGFSATGTIAGATVSGSWQHGSSTGTWQASTAGCR